MASDGQLIEQHVAPSRVHLADQMRAYVEARTQRPAPTETSAEQPPQAATLAELAEEPVATSEPPSESVRQTAGPRMSHPSFVGRQPLPPLQIPRPAASEETEAEVQGVDSGLPRGVEHVSAHSSDVEVRDIRYVMDAAREGDPAAQEYMRTIHRTVLAEILGNDEILDFLEEHGDERAKAAAKELRATRKEEREQLLDGIGDVFLQCFDGTELFRGDGSFAIDASLIVPTLTASDAALKELGKKDSNLSEAECIAKGLRKLFDGLEEPGPKEVAVTLLRIQSRYAISDDAAQEAVMQVFGEKHPGAWEAVVREMGPVKDFITQMEEFHGQIEHSRGYQTFVSLFEQHITQLNFVDNGTGRKFGSSGGVWSPVIWLYREYVSRVYHGHHVLHKDSEEHLIYGSEHAVESDSPIRYPIPDVVEKIGPLTAEDIEHLAELGGAGVQALIKGEKEPEEYFAERFSHVFAEGVGVYMEPDIQEAPDDLIMVRGDVEWLARVLDGNVDENLKGEASGTLALASEHAGQRRDSGGFMILHVPAGEGVGPFENVAVIVPPFMPEEATRLLEERYPQVTFIRSMDQIPENVPFIRNQRHQFLFPIKLRRELRSLQRIGEVDPSVVTDAIRQSKLRNKDRQILMELNGQKNMGTFDSMVLGLMGQDVPDAIRDGVENYRLTFVGEKSFFADLARGRIKGTALWSLPGPIIDYLRIRFDPTSRVTRIRRSGQPLPQIVVRTWPRPKAAVA